MRKKIKFKSLFRDFLVVLSCLSVAGFFTYLFWQDLNAFTVRNDKLEIGTISFKHNVAQRKFDDRVVWERITTGAKLYYGDTIRTSDLAQAILTLTDGTVIDLGENTMIQVGSNAGGGIQISITGGDIQIDSTVASSSVELKLDDGSVVSVDAGSSLAAKSDTESGIHNVEVKSGSAQITTESGEKADIAYGESVNVEKGREIQKRALSVIYPPKELKLLATDEKAIPVRFEWKTNGGEEATIQTSRSRSFSEITESRKVSDASSAEIGVKQGIVFWRVFSENTKDSPVEGKITVEYIKPVEGISPASESQFRYRSVLPRISFRWSGNEYVERYRLLVSATPDMRSVLADSEITGNFAVVDNLEEGSYWWQVTPYYSLNNLGYAGGSEAYPFRIVKSSQIRPPELSAPADNAQLIYKENIAGNFIWKSEIKDASYELSIARDFDFANVVYSTTTSDTRCIHEFSPADLKDGTYYWKILRKSNDSDDRNPQSEIRSFRVVRYVPQDNKLLYPPEDFAVEGSKVTGTAFMWKLADEYEKSGALAVLQISSSPNFSTIQVERATKAAVLDHLSLPSGNYWWRIGVRDEDGALKGLTQSRMITVLSELAPPEIITPAQNQEVMVYNFAPVLISWTENADAESYIVKVTKAGGEVVKIQKDIRDTSMQLVLDEGNYICFLQAVADESRISVPRECSFSVRAPSVILAESPSDGTRIAGLTALRNPVVFTWVPGKDSVSSYRFVLSKQQKDGSLKEIESIDTKKTSISMNRLTEGTYSWKVKASTANGIPLDSKSLRFSVDVTPDLASPILESPRQNFVMDGEYLKNHRAIEFIWKEVPGATAYTFALYKRETSGARKLVYTEKNTKAALVRIRELSILDVGTFEWTVTPYSYAKDGYLEQKGGVASQSFRIDFASPTKIEAVQPGKMYGK